jgi:spermidine/putrescine transport system permease protein
MEKELVMNTPNTAMEETNRSLQRREKGEKAKKAVALTFVWIMLLVMYLPIMYLILYSFTDSKVIGQWNGLNFDCYATLFNGSNVYAKQIWEATWNTVWVAVVASTLSTALGTAGAIGMHFLGKKLKAVFNFANEIPIVNAEIVMPYRYASSSPGLISQPPPSPSSSAIWSSRSRSWSSTSSLN